MKKELQRVCGVDLTSIDGINVMTAITVISEVGTDMSRFADEDHFASWMGLTPSKDITGGKVVKNSKKKVKNRVADTLRMSATTLLHSDTHLGARYRHLRRQLPTFSCAAKAMARYLAVSISSFADQRPELGRPRSSAVRATPRATATGDSAVASQSQRLHPGPARRSPLTQPQV